MKQKSFFKKAGTVLEEAMNRRNDKMLIAGIFIMMVFIASAGSAFAAGDFFADLGSSFNTIYLSLVAISPIVAGLAYVIAKLWQILTPEKQGRAEPREWARNVLFNYFLILAAGGLLGFIAKAAGNLGP